MNYRVMLVEEVSPGGGTHWLALHPDLPGCHAIGMTQQDAMDELVDARESWVRTAQRHGGTIPPEAESPLVVVKYLLKPKVAKGISARQQEKEVTIPVTA